MTVYAQTTGKRDVEIVSLTDASEVDLIMSDISSTSTLESLVACNTTTGALTLDVTYSKSGTSVYVIKEMAVAANTIFHLKDHNLPIPAGCVLRVRGSGGGLDITAVHIRDHSGSRSRPGGNW